MDKNRFQVIKGTKPKLLDAKYKFMEAHVTNTRLMGVIGLRIRWEIETGERLYQFFHMDAEEYGLDDYAGVMGGQAEDAETVTARMMGGLGGELVPIRQKEAIYLVQAFARKSRKWQQPLPEPREEYAFLLKEEVVLTAEEQGALWGKICEPLHSPYQLINYFIMRAVGTDEEGAAYLSVPGIDIDYKPVKKPATLLKNVIERVEEGGKISYITESLIDEESRYKMVLSEITVTETEKGLRVSGAEIKSSMHITSTEAAFSLGKKEYLLIYQIHDIWEAIALLDKEKPHAMRHAHEHGYLFTEFNPTNAHVDQPIYYLNDDIYGVYYITTAEQLIVGAYTKEKIQEIKEYFEGEMYEGILELEEEIDLDNLLLYEFVHSSYDNFYDFLQDE